MDNDSFKVIYMPAEVNFDKLEKVDNKFKFSPSFLNIVDQNITGNIPSLEKQLFLRALSLKFLDASNSIILIDEPEISLHPSWQQKIIKVYEKIGKNNQIIIATHSPHIVGDIEAKQLRIMKKSENGITVIKS